ncbi:carboxylesterase/lipase family protein [Mucilaginibacter gotjawali]|uniref:Carboxylic ester hydrolase n=2 Tax=Mucilaginibacter gotjawali TaxID=1550579 RepID=A0A110B3A0_9SPHI|nr:carboxylesterase family protein [Mucilaginibacter gotjawali]MBB3054147.1 para-nitrobenzyl esterase [Mucilaginibacter gotjawali]BAU54418.1 Fumonisin B1 esterase [Mucilaginibacter gotjawali]
MKSIIAFLTALVFFAPAFAQQNSQVTISNGQLTGIYNPSTGINSYKGIPYALPPVGNLRWKEPQPPANWNGVLKADHFSHMPMQKHIFSDMIFRADTMSEDCLYLNVWAPATPSETKRPVLVYFYGGGFVAGDGSESRYDGESLAQKGIVTVTISYRLGIFGFFAHPELTKESPHNASGNYGLLDQHAALLWVKANIAAFGGDPEKVTIAGESAGSFSVCAQVLSPLSKGLFSGAIGESGGFGKMSTLTNGESSGAAFAKTAGAGSLAELRALTASQLLDLASKPGAWRFPNLIDGYFFTKQPIETLEAGEEMHVPVMVGWNSAEVPYQAFTGGDMPTPENYAKKIKERYGADSTMVLKLFPGNTQDEVIKSATALASDNFIVYGTWKWADMQAKTSGKPVYRYIFSCPRPPEVGKTTENTGKLPAPMVGASHASEIEFALGNLSSNKTYAWTPDDYKVSATMEEYFANFIKTGNPNGKIVPKWKPNSKGSPVYYMNIDVNTQLEPETDADRFLFLDKLNTR